MHEHTTWCEVVKMYLY